MAIEFRDLTHGVEGAWAAFLGGLAILAVVTVRVARRGRRPALAAFARNEDGVSYSLPFVLLVPFYLFFVLVVFQAGFLLLAKIGTLYAAHAGARSAVVWQWAQPAELRDERVRQAVFTALAPFAGGNPDDVATAGSPPADALKYADDFVQAYLSYRSDGKPRSRPPGLPDDYSAETLRNKYLCAAARTAVAIDPGDGGPGASVTVTVTYRAPLLIPVVARWLGQEFAITSAATLPGEAPRSTGATLGIDYHSDHQLGGGPTP